MTIPASEYVPVNPGVIGAGGSAVDLIGLILTTNTRVPIGAPMPFSTAPAVAAFFGANSPEAAEAAVYFQGFDNSNVKPGALLFVQYPENAAVPPYLRGGSVASMTLAQLQALSGNLTLTINGEAHTTGNISLSGATSFSGAAANITTALNAFDAVVVGGISTTTLNVASVTSGNLEPGQVLSGAGVTVGTVLVAPQGNATGGVGNYTISPSQTVGGNSTTISGGPDVVTFDSQSGAFVATGGTPGAPGTIGFAAGPLATSLELTQATGAVLSQGAAQASPIAFMNSVIAASQNWATFMTMFYPDQSDREAFALWTSEQNNRYAYVMWDTDITLTESNYSSSAWYAIQQAANSGTIPAYEPSNERIGAFILGAIASIDFTEQDGRCTLAFKGQAGLTAGVIDQPTAAQLEANGVNYYGAVATAQNGFNFLYPGSVSGPFSWADTYVNQIWLNANIQLALIQLMVAVKSLPYNARGYGLVDAACMDPITAALNFGAIQPGVPLSQAQASEVNTAAGIKIDTILSTRGWYLQILPAAPSVRKARGTPPVTLWYCDGESIQRINVASLVIQ